MFGVNVSGDYSGTGRKTCLLKAGALGVPSSAAAIFSLRSKFRTERSEFFALVVWRALTSLASDIHSWEN